jgi:hypothetical protein
VVAEKPIWDKLAKVSGRARSQALTLRPPIAHPPSPSSPARVAWSKNAKVGSEPDFPPLSRQDPLARQLPTSIHQNSWLNAPNRIPDPSMGRVPGNQGRMGGPDMKTAKNMSPEETAKIRRLLTLYLASLITFPDERPSHFQLCNPETALEVKSIPREVIGLRRQYLKEVQANIKARSDYQDLLTQRAGPGETGEDVADAGDGVARLETHLRLLQLRKRCEEVRIARHYLEKLKETNPAKDGGLHFRQHPIDEDATMASLQALLEIGDGSTGRDSTEDLMKKLERAVITAKYQLEREERLLAEAKARHPKGSSTNQDNRPRLNALATTRDELVRFLEEKMSSDSLEYDNSAHSAVENGAEPALDREQVQEEIQAEYEKYLTARKRLLDVASTALSAPGEPESHDTVSRKDTEVVDNRVGAPLPVITQPALSVLPFISEQLLPLLRNQKAHALQRSYTSKVLNTERRKALDSLELLADESHLLPAYPIMARQARFKNVVGALGGPKKPDHAMVDAGEDTDEMIKRVEAWAFAAEEASKAGDGFVMGKVNYGNERLDEAEGSLALLDKLLGKDPQRFAAAGHGGDEADIWLEAAGAGTENAQNRRARPIQQESGPWAGLNGAVGLADGRGA